MAGGSTAGSSQSTADTGPSSIGAVDHATARGSHGTDSFPIVVAAVAALVIGGASLGGARWLRHRRDD